jgi:large subunit ribosomal protein L17
MLAGLAKVLILHKRINTTLAKAKALRKFVEPILTKAKQDTTHARRVVFSYFQDKVPVKELFNDIAPKIANRPGGYTRIIRLGNRLGDNAEMCMIELVDYNELFQKRTNTEPTKTRRSRSKATAVANQEEETHVSADTQLPLALTPEAISTEGSEDQEKLLKVPTQVDTKEEDEITSEFSTVRDIEKDD